MKSPLRALLSTTCLTAVLLYTAGVAHANPQGGVVSAGSASIAEAGKILTVNQSSNKTVIDWRGFDIAPDETTAFRQPSSSALALNRVNSDHASDIEGHLTANGNVIIVNQNGVLFGPTSHVDVNGLIATTADIDNAAFMNNSTLAFTKPGNPDAAIVNQGQITAGQAGLVGFVAPNVINSGIITARLGHIQLASGDTATVDLYGDNLMEVAVSDQVKSQLVANTGTLEADGGKVALTAAAGAQIVNSLISTKGTLQAQSVGTKNGEIIIAAAGSNAVAGNVTTNKSKKTGNSTVLVSGVLDASGKNAGETGGTIEVLGDNVGILNGSLLDASGDAGGGTIRVGGDYHGAGDTPTALHSIMQSGATMDASALTSGSGGNVTLWADDWTTFAGNILAKAGSLFGDGGFVETSGKQTLVASGLVDAFAPNGTGGTWLLDPNNITISTGANANEAGDPNFTSTNDSSVVNTTSIQTDLNNGTNVSITTASAGANTQLGDITVSNTITKSLSGGSGNATLTLSAANNITINAAITSTSGKLGVVLDADSDASGSGEITVGAAITSNGGNITMGGGATPATTAAFGNATSADGVQINNVTVDAGGGNISIRGTGFNTTTNNNYGVYVAGASGKVQTSGSGTVTITGTGAGNTNSGGDYGVFLNTGGVVSAVDGLLSVSGTGGGAGTGGSNLGVFVTGAGSTIKTTGLGALSVTGTGGNAAGSGGSNFGVYVNAGSITGAGGAMNITGTGGNSSGNSNLGVYVTSATGVVSNTGTGTITINGTGAGNTNSATDYGVDVSTGGVVSAVDGLLTVTGTGGGAGTGINNYGVYVTGASSTIKTTGLGGLSVTGTGGNAAGSSANNYGVFVNTGGGLQTTGSGTITVNGTGSAGSGGNNDGVYNAGSITGAGGAINITGTGGNGRGNINYGVRVTGATGVISNTSSGTITISGTGAGNTNSDTDDGVEVDTGGVVSTVDGLLSVTGTGGGAGTGASNVGVYVTGAGSTIKTTGLGGAQRYRHGW
jgi:filamentous hemagglutinin family protein